ncbi:helix-turn-helix domain-containing protein [Lacticaseibacillus paracasei]|uniref:helix-turn-helix domain-containing protein n=1 Tax=Lacticaseibacillus paracasei TaxID=1597 RepID=UPI0021C2A993|nr:helix-turn-helix transcriptional regulator [Lacticaseibacillus paracasei]MCP9304598.1 helix-turn-helix transcriptional regulator [Lacticaseibacillus paracasei]
MIGHQRNANSKGQDWARERLRNFIDVHPRLPVYRFALIAGVSRITIANFLDGKEVMQGTLIKIAKAMGISIDKLRQPISDQEYMELRQEEKA